MSGVAEPAEGHTPPYSMMQAQLNDKKKLQELLTRQVQMETTAVEVAVERYVEMAGRTTERLAGGTLPAAKRLVVRWFQPLVEAIREEQAKCLVRTSGVDRRSYADMLGSLKAEELAVITLHCILSLLMKGENVRAHDEVMEVRLSEAGVVKTVKAVSFIGDSVQAQINMNAGKKATSGARAPGGRLARSKLKAKDLEDYVYASLDELDKEKQNAAAAKDTPKLSDSQKKAALTEELKEAVEINDQLSRLRVKVGSVLLHLLMSTCTLNVPGKVPGETIEQAAFYADYMTGPKGRRYGTVAWHDSVLQVINDEAIVRLAMQPRYLPMLVPAKPWLKYNSGAYMQLESLIMRGGYTRMGPAAAQLAELRRVQEEMDGGEGGMGRIYRALTVLGQTPWRINVNVLDVMMEVWTKYGGGMAGLPAREDMFLPLMPTRRYTLYRRTQDDRLSGQLLAFGHFSEGEMSSYKRTVKKVRQKNRELQSMRCDFVYKLQVAKDLRHEEAIYYPHNVDFRGRAYTMHPHLNHLGADHCRGLLTFADPRPLGEHGLRWLFIQAANLFANGVDKYAMDAREAYMRENVELILDSANDPLHGRRWWCSAEDPWQFLACCFEIRDALNSPDPSQFLSRLPCHQDGSCNGLQHYAALGRDEMGGRSVNILPADRPADVYSGIAELVREQVLLDAQSDHIDRSRLAKLLLEHVDRKLVKQTVMTSVYGVTYVGARQQIQNRLKERGAFPLEDVRYKVSNYAAAKTLTALNNMFTNARAVMDWLTLSAKVVADSGECVKWRTPLGLPVVQPYRKKSKSLVRTVLQTFALQSENESKPVTKMKQRSAFPPNFIHSIDSSHMMLTAIGCHEAGLTFAGVHDSFWTHASSVPVMNRILREKFVELHGEPLLEQLHSEFQREFPDVAHLLPPPPSKGSLDITRVLDSDYFFS